MAQCSRARILLRREIGIGAENIGHRGAQRPQPLAHRNAALEQEGADVVGAQGLEPWTPLIKRLLFSLRNQWAACKGNYFVMVLDQYVRREM
jgi:hypothetical protein